MGAHAILCIGVVSVLLKVLLLLHVPYSTDFEVHRNWMAITHSLPMSSWYFENTSQWTMDYPPFFAYLEYGLSLFAPKESLSITHEMCPVHSLSTIMYQKLTVSLLDLVYLISIWMLFGNNVSVVLFLFFNPGLLFLDHFHFQYNAFLVGILFLSFHFARCNKYILSAIMFAVLLNLKHIFLYAAPAFFVFFLSMYCSKKPIRGIFELGVAVSAVFALSLVPLFLFGGRGQILQLLQRLFPFKRGLCHAYWAPNVWAIYNAVDKTLGWILKYSRDVGAMTRGLVGDTVHVVLPSISPSITLVLTFVFLLPTLVWCWRRHDKFTLGDFELVVSQCQLTFFLFGWHAHEKAFLVSILPLGIVAFTSSYPHQASVRKLFFFATVVSCYSLFPLLWQPELRLLRGLTLLFFVIAWREFCPLGDDASMSMSRFHDYYLVGLVGIEFISVILTPLWLIEKLPFFNLMLTSVYCSIGALMVFFEGFRTMWISS